MKLKSLNSKLSLIAGLVFISTTSMAMNITNGKLLSHSTSTTGNNVHGSIEEKSDNKLKTMFLNLKNKSFNLDENVTGEGIFAVPMIEKASGAINTPIPVTGSTEFIIDNRTPETHVYDLETSICVEGGPSKFSDCFMVTDQISLAPEGTATYSQTPEFTLYQIFDSAVTKKTSIITSVRSDSGNVLFMTSACSSVEAKN